MPFQAQLSIFYFVFQGHQLTLKTYNKTQNYPSQGRVENTPAACMSLLFGSHLVKRSHAPLARTDSIVCAYGVAKSVLNDIKSTLNIFLQNMEVLTETSISTSGFS